MAVCLAPSPTTSAPVVVFRNSRRANPPGVSALFFVMSDMASLPPNGPEHIPGNFNEPYLTLRIVLLRACASFSDQKAQSATHLFGGVGWEWTRQDGRAR